jgi:hypothetical protein
VIAANQVPTERVDTPLTEFWSCGAVAIGCGFTMRMLRGGESATAAAHTSALRWAVAVRAKATSNHN